MNATIFNKLINIAAHVIFQYDIPLVSSCDFYISAEFRAALTACPHETSTHMYFIYSSLLSALS